MRRKSFFETRFELLGWEIGKNDGQKNLICLAPLKSILVMREFQSWEKFSQSHGISYGPLEISPVDGVQEVGDGVVGPRHRPLHW